MKLSMQYKEIMGLATQERGSRSMRILSGLANAIPDHQDCVYMVNRRSRFASVLRVVLEDATLTLCSFYRVLKRDAIHARPLLVHTRTYALIVVFKSTNTRSYLCTVENFTQIQI